MPPADETLSTFAQVAVALAGFSGIIIAFGRRSQGALTRLEVRRLSNLFALSGFVLLIALAAIAMLHAQWLEPSILWRALSGAVLLFGTPWLALDLRKLGRLETAERATVNTTMVYAFDTLALAALLLQLYNVVSAATAWPFLIGLVVVVMFAFQQFILLVRMGFNEQ